MGFEPPTGIQRPAHQRLQAREANQMIDKMTDIEQFIREEMTWAQAMQEEFANRRRTGAPSYRVGDEVWLDARNIRTKRKSKKLDWKNLGKFLITQVVSPYAYRLGLPNTMKIHPVFHVSLLRPAAPSSDYLPGQENSPPEPVEIDGEPEYYIDRIEDLRFNRRRKRHEYLVKWTGYDELSWEPALELKDTTAAADYHRRHPNIPEPPDIRLYDHKGPTQKASANHPRATQYDFNAQETWV